MAGIKSFDENEVLEKAMVLFWTKGYSATSAQDLVDTLRISRSSLYNTYGDKHSLFLKTLLNYRKKWIDPVIERANRVENAEIYILELFDFIKRETFDLNQSKGCFWINTAIELVPKDIEVSRIALDIMHDTEDAFHKVISHGQKQGVFTKSYSSQSLAKFIFNSINGLRVNVKLEVNEENFDNVVNLCLTLLKIGIKK